MKQFLLLSCLVFLSALFFHQNYYKTSNESESKPFTRKFPIETDEFIQKQKIRRKAIKESFQHVWNGYSKHSFVIINNI